MTDLLPPRDGQEDSLGKTERDRLDDLLDHIYEYGTSSEGVSKLAARLCLAARKEEREACIKALAMRCEFYALNTDDESENVVSECIHIIKGMGEK